MMESSNFNQRLQGQDFLIPLPSSLQGPRMKLLLALSERLEACYSDDDCSILIGHERPDLLSYIGGLPEEALGKILMNLHQRDFAASLKEFHYFIHPHRENPSSSIWASLSQHWADPYAGDALTALMEKISEYEKENIENPGILYSKSISLIQSSGTGKSRLVSEIGKKNLTISFTLRDEHSQGYPPGDPEILDFLLRPSHDQRQDEIHCRIAALLSAALTNVNFWLQAQDLTRCGIEVVIKQWHDAMSPLQLGDQGKSEKRSMDRIKICTQIVEDAKRLRHEFVGDDSWVQDLVNSRHESFTSLPIINKLLVSPAQALLRTLGWQPQNLGNSPLVFLAFDEVHALDSSTTMQQSQPIVFPALRRMLIVFSGLPVWALFLSTNSNIGTMAPAPVDDPSSRIKAGKFKCPPPYFAFPVDIEAIRRWKDSSPPESKKPLARFSDIDHLTTYGRPLWQAYTTQPKKVLQDFVVFKLLLGELEEDGEKRMVQNFALMASRLCLEPAMNDAESISLAAESVKSHLRFVTGWSDGFFSSSTPSEPLVSDAAAEVLMKKVVLQEKGKNTVPSEYCWTNVIKAFATELLSSGRVSKGIRGELFGRLACILACDFARELSVPDDQVHPNSCRYSTPIRVQDFLRELLGADIPQNISNYPLEEFSSRTGKRGGATVGAALGQAFLTLNHFTFAKKSIPHNPSSTTKSLGVMLRKHAALQLTETQEHWDLLLPMYVGSIDEPFASNCVSVMLVQIKNRKVQKEIFHPFGTKLSTYFQTNNIIIQLFFELGSGSPKSGVEYELFHDQHATTVCINVYGAQALASICKTPGLQAACLSLLEQLEREKVNTTEDEIVERIRGFNWQD